MASDNMSGPSGVRSAIRVIAGIVVGMLVASVAAAMIVALAFGIGAGFHFSGAPASLFMNGAMFVGLVVGILLFIAIVRAFGGRRG